MSKMLLTRTTSLAPISIEETLFLKSYAVDGVIRAEYLDEEDGFRKTINVNETLANIASMSNLLISTTSESGATILVNYYRVNGVSELNSLAVLDFDAAGASNESFTLGITMDAWNTLVIEKSGDISYTIDSFTAAPKNILLDTSEGDVESNFPLGKTFTVYGEGDANDNIYTVVSAAWDGTNTVITVNETTVLNAAATGFVWLPVESSTTAPSYDPGTAATGVTASHASGDGKHFVSTFTFAALATPGVAAAANEAIGVLLYTFPAGVHAHKVTNMDVALQGGGVVDADAPEVGIGSVIGTGAVAVLSTTLEDYIEGQVATNCSGTATVKMTAATAGYGTGISLNEVGDVKALHLNIADGWAGADTLDATGTVTIEWTIV